MPESAATATEESSVKFLLDKPLHHLTEDDIAQVTREDCRRYLKEKGMRKPSWNKSQAIQQVIMLKRLLETTTSDYGKRLRVPVHDNDTSVPVLKGMYHQPQNSLSGEVLAPYGGKDLEKPDSSANHESIGPRTKGSTDASGQMTIFYSGKVNVYDGVQADKARALLQIASSPLKAPQEQTVEGSTILQPLSRFSQAVSSKARPDSAVLFFPILQTGKMIDNSLKLGEEGSIFCEKTPVEGLSTRKAYVQRYLEKRNKFKSKIKPDVASCTSIDVYSANQGVKEKADRSRTCSPIQIISPFTPTQSSSVDNSVNNVCSPGVINKKVCRWSGVDGCVQLRMPRWRLNVCSIFVNQTSSFVGSLR